MNVRELEANFMSVQNVMSILKEKNIEWVDFRFTDIGGTSHHISVPAVEVDEDTFVNGVALMVPRSQALRALKNPIWL
jgi:glutamine synthetase